MKSIEVLLVEDSAGDVLLMKQALAEEPVPINIHVALDGKQAVEMLSQGLFTPSVIVLDLDLPKLSGLGFLEWYRADVPLVVFSSSSKPEDRGRALQLGAREYVQKPTDPTEYRRLLSQIVRNWGTPPPVGAIAGT